MSKICYFIVEFSESRRFPSGQEFMCIRGEGNSAEALKEIRNISMDSCKQTCLADNKCVATDYSNSHDFIDSSSCRIFDSTTMSTDLGRIDHSFCSKGIKRYDKIVICSTIITF